MWAFRCFVTCTEQHCIPTQMAGEMNHESIIYCRNCYPHGRILPREVAMRKLASRCQYFTQRNPLAHVASRSANDVTFCLLPLLLIFQCIIENKLPKVKINILSMHCASSRRISYRINILTFLHSSTALRLFLGVIHRTPAWKANVLSMIS